MLELSGRAAEPARRPPDKTAPKMPRKKKQTRKRRRRSTPLTRNIVLATALKIADAGGIESLSMRKVAQELKVEAMSLYNHVKNKDDILDGIIELVVSEIEVPTIGGDWRAAMRQRSLSAHEVLMRHSWATMLLMSRPNVGPAMLRYVDATIGCLRAAGFSFALADYAWNALDSHLYGFTLQQLNFPFEPDEYADAAENFLPMLPQDQYPHLYALSMEVMKGRHDGRNQLSFGLDLILDGLDRLRVAN